MPSPTKLEAIVNMEKMLQRTPEQIGSLWQEVSHLSMPRHPTALVKHQATCCQMSQGGQHTELFSLQYHAKDKNAAVLGSTEWKAYSTRAKAWYWY